MLKRSLSVRWMVCLLMLLCTHVVAYAQEQKEDLITYEINGPEKVKAGDTFKISVIFKIQPGWYIYAPVAFNVQQGKTVSKVTFRLPEGIVPVDGLELPKNAGGLATYTGSGVTMIQRFKMVKPDGSGQMVIQANVMYQTCNDQICMAPVREKKSVIIRVQ